ncbi:protein FIZZY-RELATED 3-like [Triticum urartu]|uniref:CDC20/Fizzy WD40 domain-containing protein n=1 Tax=Triticum urartu TaxID=4572 RepID=A0A8R7PYE2_TRIUA|nr:protein FIZZY-RELATED 3-like [Triticum urartu]
MAAAASGASVGAGAGAGAKPGRLNVPAGMAGSLRLDASSPASSSSSVARLLEIPKTPSPSKVTYSDRFIPCRTSSRLHNFALADRPSPGSGSRDDGSAYSRLLRAELFGDASSPGGDRQDSPGSNNLFRFKTDRSSAPSSPFAEKLDCAGGAGSPPPKKAPRKVPKTPHKVLDAPSLQDDFYLNLVDWSSQNMLAVGLGTCVYLWSASSSKVTKLCDLGPRDSVCAVHWTREGSYLAVGTSLGDVQIWDSSRCKRIRNMGGHQTRAGVLAWNSTILSSGSRDKNILQHDIRVPTDYISKFSGHRSEVCGLKWSHDDRELASGGNDNQLLVWNQRSQQPVLRLTEHTAAVKAITWSPHQHSLVASGGGTADRCIKFWNTANGNMLNSIDTGSQVCNLAWCKNVNELVSTHGYSQNQIMVWKYPSMSKVATLTGHTLRVLYLATSPDGQTIVTGAGDETLRFWNIFPSMKAQAPARDAGLFSFPRSHIR